MRKLLVPLVCALALAAAAPASADVVVGVSDDLPASTHDGGASFYAAMQELGLRENRIAVKWDAAAPTAIPDQAGLARAIAEAQARGVKVVLSLYPLRPNGITSSPNGAARFVAWTAHVARTFPQVTDFIIGNEPNVNRFWQPQFAGRRAISCATYEGVLAGAYDTLKGVNPAITVIGVGLSPRGNDNPRTTVNPSTSPVRCLRDMGLAYKASARQRPIMDELSFHPFPFLNTDPMLRGYLWPNAGFPNLDRIKQAVWDSFSGTGQPVFPEASFGRFSAFAAAPALRFRLNEVGWQVAIIPSARGAYFGRETVPTVEEPTQAQIYADAIPFVACDPAVHSLLYFHLVDDRDLDRWQSGLIRADGTRRPSFDAVKASLARTGGRCQGIPTAWRHATTVIGPSVRFPPKTRRKATERGGSFIATALEDAAYAAGVFRIGARGRPTARARAKMAAALRKTKPRGAVLVARGRVKSNRESVVRFPARRLKAGRYVYAAQLSAEMNPLRRSFFVSKPFTVVAAKKKR